MQRLCEHRVVASRSGHAHCRCRDLRACAAVGLAGGQQRQRTFLGATGPREDFLRFPWEEGQRGKRRREPSRAAIVPYCDAVDGVEDGGLMMIEDEVTR